MKHLAQIDGASERLGVLYKTIPSPEETGGAMSILDSWSPAASRPPRHVHQTESETFVILTGACKFWLDGDEFTTSAGESLFIPRSKAHTLKVTDDGPCRRLMILTPSGFEGFFADMATGQGRIPEDMPAFEESAKRHNMAFTSAPLG